MTVVMTVVMMMVQCDGIGRVLMVHCYRRIRSQLIGIGGFTSGSR
jgi:hypothetical protein